MGFGKSEKDRGIGRKVNRLLLVMVTASLLLAGAVGIYGQCFVMELSGKSSRKLGVTAASDAELALERLAVEHLTDMAQERAAYIAEKFECVEADVLGIAAQAEAVYGDPAGYPDRSVPLPVPGSRRMAAQLLWSERIAPNGERPEETEEILKLGNLQDMLVQYNSQNDMISSAYLATKSGWMIQADTAAYRKYGETGALPLPYEADERQWYQMALEAAPETTVYTDIFPDIHSGRDCIVCAAPVYHNGQVEAVAGIGSYLETINRVVLDTELLGDGYAFLVNEKGHIIVSGREDGETAAFGVQSGDIRESENRKLAETAKLMLSGESGYRRLVVDGKAVYLAYAPLPKLGWSFVTVVDAEKILSPAVESQENILALAQDVEREQEETILRMLFVYAGLYLLLIAAIYGGGMCFSNRLTKPIRELTKEVAQLDGGNLDHRIHLCTGDEVEALGVAFNRMAHRIQRYIRNLEAVTAEKERIRTEIQVAARLQADMLPEAPGELSGRPEFELRARMVPAKGVGGDFYDFFLLDEDHLVLIMADVSGKGVPAALFMVVARTLIRIHLSSRYGGFCYREGCLGSVVEGINDALCANNPNGMFVTAWLGILTVSSGRLEYVNAGHCPPLLLGEDGTGTYVDRRSGFVLAGMEGGSYRSYLLELKEGEMLLLYTDGVTEASSRQRELYGEKRLKQTAEQADGASPGELIRILWESIDAFQKDAEPFDDVTMLCLAYYGANHWEMSSAADIRRLSDQQLFLESILTEKGIARKQIRTLKMALDEIYSNICYYSGAGEVTQKIRMTREGKRVTLILTDDGRPYNPLETPEPNLHEPLWQRKEGGLGIYLVKKWMHRIEYEYIDGKNCLTLTVREEVTTGK